MIPKIKIYSLPWTTFNFTKLKNKIIIDAGKFSIWITWKKEK